MGELAGLRRQESRLLNNWARATSRKNKTKQMSTMLTLSQAIRIITRLQLAAMITIVTSITAEFRNKTTKVMHSSLTAMNTTIPATTTTKRTEEEIGNHSGRIKIIHTQISNKPQKI